LARQTDSELLAWHEKVGRRRQPTGKRGVTFWWVTFRPHRGRRLNPERRARLARRLLAANTSRRQALLVR
jgi:hypothetical protein